MRLKIMPRRFAPRAPGPLAASILAVMAIGGPAYIAARDGGTRAFLIGTSQLAFHFGDLAEDCPSGLPTVEEQFLATVSPKERERLLRPENAKEYARKWKEEFITGPGGENVCNNPKSFVNDPRHPPFEGARSKVAYGLNLDGTEDGRPTAKTCGHQKFAGLNGEPRVDNQLYRAIACTKLHRENGNNDRPELNPYVIELRGLDDPQDDPEVEVGIYTIDDPPLQAVDGKYLPYQTVTATSNPRWRTTTKGELKNGVLVTKTIDVMYLRWTLPTWGALGQGYEHEFRDVRFRVTLEPDGTISGVMGGYRPLDNIMTIERCCRGTASTANHNCASEQKTFLALADGYPDPVTGQCTMISAAHKVGGVPAFLAHPPVSTAK